MKKLVIVLGLALSVLIWKQFHRNSPATQYYGKKTYKYFEEGYKCQTESGHLVETYRDAIVLEENGDVCRLGNGCNTSVHCGVDVSSLTLSGDQHWLAYDGHIYMRE